MDKQFTFKAGVWLMTDYDIRDVKADNDRLPYITTFLPSEVRAEYWTSVGYAFIGNAVITIERVTPTAELIQAQVKSLRKLAAKERADGEAKAQMIEARISNLLCLENGA